MLAVGKQLEQIASIFEACLGNGRCAQLLM